MRVVLLRYRRVQDNTVKASILACTDFLKIKIHTVQLRYLCFAPALAWEFVILRQFSCREENIGHASLPVQL